MRELDEGSDVAAEEVLAVAQADHQRRVAASADDDAGLVGVHDEQGEGALEAVHDPSQRLGEVADRAVLAGDEVGGDLGVGLGGEDRALEEELFFQVGEVLDDAVVDQRQLATVGEVRVRVLIGRAAVGRPAGVPDAGRAVHQRRSVEVVDEHLQLAGLLAHVESAVRADHGHAGGVVPPVFEALETAEEDLDALVRTDVTHDATHASQPIRRRLHGSSASRCRSVRP
ncbi:hypothetical protein GCM10025867_13530 [Frondihabitans sucicola]|uniref:Uncharacterized protein n=1 Tax=Frondihabitans sucicola TaxID=1268041 RepID=A0ABN6XZ33_9MICO|nr:hypothetical protein GCM10025867_13530 [Frondihabitans sucicola]